MIVELICTPLFIMLRGLIFLLPTAFTIPDWTISFIALIQRALFFFPADVWYIVVGNIVFWLIAQMTWAIIEWVYKKIPRNKLKEFFMREYEILREKFIDLNEFEFSYVWDNYRRLKRHYKIIKTCQFLERIKIPIVKIPIFNFFFKVIDFLRYVIHDCLMAIVNGKQFKFYGLTVFCGRQGGGKTVSMVEYLDKIKKEYPDCVVVTNFHYVSQDMAFTDWKQFLEVRNGENGVIFAIDELQNEYNSSNWKDFPETLLSTVTMQRKQRIKIVATSQVFTRVVKQLREQCYEVVECKTLLGRWTRQKCYDADDYNRIIDNPDPKVKFKTPKKWKYSFIQSNAIRNLFDSYAVVEKMKNTEFISRNERGQEGY